MLVHLERSLEGQPLVKSQGRIQEDLPFVWQIFVLLGNHTSLQSERNTGSHSVSKRPARKAKRCPPKR